MNRKPKPIRRFLPAAQISLGLVLVTASILLVSEWFGFIPSESEAILEGRKKISESLAIQFSILATQKDIGKIRNTLDALVTRNSDILSAGLRDVDGHLRLKAGPHDQLWDGYDQKTSTETEVVVPIFRGNKQWASIEITFKPITTETFRVLGENPVFQFVLFVAGVGFVGYLMIILRTLRQLDPSAVIPERVSAAFNTLAEGVLILDEDEQIVLANTAFTDTLGCPPESLTGIKASQLGWDISSEKTTGKTFPWLRTLESGESQIGVTLILKTPSISSDTTRTLSINSAPICDSQGKNRGVLATFDDITELEQKNDQLKTIVSKLEKSQIEVQRKNKELHFLATQDPLTGCLNRRAFNETFESAFNAANSDHGELTCLMVDLDHFKSVNDTYGHATGDEVIKLLADILHQSTRDEDVVGRYGGEEFCVVLPGLGFEAAMVIAEKIRLKIKQDSEKTFISGPRVTASIGVGSIKDGAKDPSELNIQADKALYIAKESGRNRVVQWSRKQTEQPEQDPEVLLNQAEVAPHYAKQMKGRNSYKMFDGKTHKISAEQIHVESELRRAIENDEFVLYYQPKMDMESVTPKGVEALIRWNHPTRGLLTPNEFIDVAEQSGLIVDIGDWVIKQACLQAKAWIEMGIEHPRIAVNLSTLQLGQRNFSDRILAILADMNLSPSHLELEITETVIMDNLNTAIETLNCLHKQGFRIAIDDFGTGYSSLNYLKHLPLDTLKIDRSFLRDILTDDYDKTIVKTIIAMAHSMDLTVTAEGVETEEQLTLLRQYSCDEIQGYLFSRPVPPDKATLLLQAKSHSDIKFAG